MRSTAHTSALVMFLDALTALDLGGGQICRGLPSTLEHLVLMGKYRTWNHLYTSLLRQLSCLARTWKFRVPAFHKIVGVSSWQQLSYDEEMEIVR